MKTKMILAGIAVLLTAPLAAQAADLPSPYKAQPGLVTPAYTNWTGFYVGLNGGYGFGTSNWTNALSTTGSFNTTGYMVGGTVGYNLMTGKWVWGFETDLDWSDIKGTSTTGLYCGGLGLLSGCETKNTWLGTARGRIGYAFDRWLPYFTGGVAYGAVKMTPPAAFGPGETETRMGWTLGAGVEYAFMGNWSAKLEYLYVDLGTASCAAANCLLATDVKVNSNLVRVGVNYRF